MPHATELHTDNFCLPAEWCYPIDGPEACMGQGAPIHPIVHCGHRTPCFIDLEYVPLSTHI